MGQFSLKKESLKDRITYIFAFFPDKLIIKVFKPNKSWELRNEKIIIGI